MKHLILATFCFLLSMPALAEGWQENCSLMGSLAESIMNARQVGVSMETMMRVIGESNYESGSELEESIESMIIAAYKEPRYSGEGMQKRTTEEFRDKVYRECVIVFRD